MKRIRSRDQYQRFQRSCGRYSLNNRQRRKAYLRRIALGLPLEVQAAHLLTSRPRQGYTGIVAPQVLSMAGNAEETILFFSKLSNQFDHGVKTFVSLRKIVRLDYDAIVVLLAIMIRFKAAGIGFYGDFPRHGATTSLLIKSGFFQKLYRKVEERDTYTVGSARGILTHANRCVDPTLSDLTISQAAQTIWGDKRRSKGVYRVLMELMQNTNNHAWPHKQGEKQWWMSVHHQKKTKSVSFVFVDFGVGVFDSLDSKAPGDKWYDWRPKLGKLFSSNNNADVLALILEGKLHQTVTRQSFRGKGLPGISAVFGRGSISNLVIITNDVYAKLATSEFRTLGSPFRGTMVSWDVNQSGGWIE